jgi:hypothetical protein
MIILTTSTALQTLNIIPRVFETTIYFVVRDDSTNTSVSYTVTSTKNGNYMVIDNSFALVDNHFYDFEIFSDVGETVSIYKDRIFCTDQNTNQLNGFQYNLNNGEYTSYDGYNNTYIVR